MAGGTAAKALSPAHPAAPAASEKAPVTQFGIVESVSSNSFTVNTGVQVPVVNQTVPLSTATIQTTPATVYNDGATGKQYRSLTKGQYVEVYYAHDNNTGQIDPGTPAASVFIISQPGSGL